MKLRELAIPALAVLLGMALVEPGAASGQQTGSITGVVTNVENRQPLAGAQVSVEGTTRRATTGEDGRYTISGIPSGTYRVRASLIGHATEMRENVQVSPGAVATVNFGLRAEALALNELVVTGVVDATSGARLPFSVAKVSTEQLQVPATTSAIANIAGKVAGATIVSGTGQPGTGVSIQLRTPTSIQKSNSPLIVVDGVILGSSSVDIESMDIESIEVVKGAAAASLYGSRAASGVVQIRTKRGKDVQGERTRITARTEYGVNQLNRTLPFARHHWFLTNEQGQFVNAQGEVVPRGNRLISPSRIADQPYIDPLFNHIDAAFDPGRFNTNTVSMAQNSERTNWHASAVNYREPGVLVNNEGYTRNSFRLNLDHRLRDNLNVSMTGYHMRSDRDDITGGTSASTGIFGTLLLLPPDVNLLARDSLGNLQIQPDPNLATENPIWRQTTRDFLSERTRTLGAINSRYSPLDWVTFEGDFQYDRSDRGLSWYTPKGVPTISGEGTTGAISKENGETQQINASAGATLLRDIGKLTTRTTVRGSIEREDDDYFLSEGTDLLIGGIPDLDVARNRTVSSSFTDVRTDGYFVSTALDYADKYIGDFLVRRDGSSLFGPEERWKTYYRASAAYRMEQEPWWPARDIITLFKPRYSIGTAGGRPAFSDQYETFNFNATTGSVTRGNLGNRFLKPEHTTEQELGLDMILRGRYSLQLTYATQKTEDQIIQVPQAAVTGFFNQWGNAGTLEGRTYEASLEAQLIRKPGFSWTANVVADRSRHKITEWNRTCFVSGITFRCAGETLGIYYGERHVTDRSGLPAVHTGSQDQFQLNDDGFLVPVGTGSTWQDRKFGTTVTIDGVRYAWGLPIVQRDSLGGTALVKIGDANPDFKLGFGNNIRWRGIGLYSLFDAQIGGDIYNSTAQRMYQNFRHVDVDQAGKPEERKKPIDYYTGIYNRANNTEYFVEDATYLKLRELSLRYEFGESQLRSFGFGRLGTDRISVALIGRNLFTWTGYSGFDPEVGNATLRQDNFVYPKYRTITAAVEVGF